MTTQILHLNLEQNMYDKPYLLHTANLTKSDE